MSSSTPPPPTTTTTSHAEAVDRVDTCDAEDALTRTHARALADRYFFLGFLALPWLWVLNAWTFAPHLRAAPSTVGVDAHVRSRARASLVLGILAHLVLLAWALVFYFGGERTLGRAMWERLSVTTVEL
jgi:hypothetical protein